MTLDNMDSPVKRLVHAVTVSLLKSVFRSLSLSPYHLLFLETVCQHAEPSNDGLFGWTLTPIILPGFPNCQHTQSSVGCSVTPPLISLSLAFCHPCYVSVCLSTSMPCCLCNCHSVFPSASVLTLLSKEIHSMIFSAVVSVFTRKGDVMS